MKTLLILIASCLSVNGQAMFFSQNVSTAVAPILRVSAASGSDVTGTPAASVATSTFAAATGNLIVVFARQGLSATATLTPIDTAGNVYTLISYVSLGAGDRAGLWYAKNTVANASNAVTAIWQVSGVNTAMPFTAVSAIQYSGLSTTAPLDISNTATASGVGTVTSPAFTTTAANEVVVAGATANALGNAYVADTGNGYAIRTQDASPIQAMEDKIVSVIQTAATVSMSTGTNPQWEFALASFKQ